MLFFDNKLVVMKMCLMFLFLCLFCLSLVWCIRSCDYLVFRGAMMDAEPLGFCFEVLMIQMLICVCVYA